MASKFEWILFDLDNTLLNFNATSQLALKKIASLLSLEANEDFYRVYNNLNNQIWMEFELKMITSQEIKSKRFERLADHYGKKVDGLALNTIYLRELVKYPVVMDNAIEILDSLHNKYKLGLITNGLKEVQRPRLRKSNIEKYFDQIVVSDEIGVSKPSFEYFDYTHQLIGKPQKEKVLVVGDKLSSDIQGANNYGYHSCLYSQEKKEQDSIIPNFNINNLMELPAILEGSAR